ncbi:MAG: VIT1/CCC1 transporter family protein [Actinobacteria bacterium]|nr:VIT1/CCC1 transporter family protein [Actinomycetota bacterium]
MSPHFRKKAKLPFDRDLFLSTFSGLEAGVATTTAIILGLLISGGSIDIVATAAYITLSVQAFNSAAARYMSLRTSMEIDDQNESEVKKPLLNAIAQFTSHVTASSMPILPLFFMQDRLQIAITAVLMSIGTLLIAGLIQGIFLKVQARHNLQEIVLTGMMVVLIGSLAGFLLS